MAAAPNQIEEIKQKLDITSVVQSYVPSLKARGRNWFGLCPFHSEKSPSFSVNPELGIYKCFGCGEGGDVISFLQKLEGLEFREALEMAAEKAGVDLQSGGGNIDPDFKRKKKRALEAHRLAAAYYHYLLTEHVSGKPGLEYAMEKRKLDLDAIKKFQLGYAPRSYHNLETFLLKKGYSSAELVEFGLLAERDGRHYDKFRGRLLHPIQTLTGEVVGFSGRAIFPDDKGPKYLNSPETIVYHKKATVYGGFQAKDPMRKLRQVVIVEGNLDVVSSARVGVENIICPLGTALTAEQVKLLGRYVDEAVLAFDKDRAGQAALLRAYELLEAHGLVTKVAVLPGETKDVDELAVQDPEAWKNAAASAIELCDYVMQFSRANYDLTTAQGKSQYVKHCLYYVGKLRSAVKQEHYLQQLANNTGLEIELLRRELRREQTAGAAQTATTYKVPVADTAPTLEEELQKPERLPFPPRFVALLGYFQRYQEEMVAQEEEWQPLLELLAAHERNLLLLAVDRFPAELPAVGLQQELAQELAKSPALNAANFQEILHTLRVYVRERLRVYLRQMKTLEESPQKMERINTYATKLAALDKVI